MDELKDLIETKISQKIENFIVSMMGDEEMGEMQSYLKRVTGIEYDMEDIFRITKSYINRLGI